MKRIFNLFFVLILSFAFSLLLESQVFAATISRNIATTMQIANTEKVLVTQTQKISWDDKKTYFPAKKNALIVYVVPPYGDAGIDLNTKISNVQVKDANNNSITFATSVEDGFYKIRIPYYRDLKNGSPLEFKISYQTDLNILNEGGILEISYPGLPADFSVDFKDPTVDYSEKTTYDLTLLVAKSLGEISLTTPNPAQVEDAGTQTKIRYSHNELREKSVRIMVGSERLIKFSLTGKVKATNQNSPNFVKDLLVNYVEIALPTQQDATEFANQVVYYSKISPYPESLRIDQDGNVIARLPISATSESEVVIEGYAKIVKGEIPKTIQSTKFEDLPNSMENYLGSEPRYWQVEASEIQKIATENLSKSGQVYETVQKSLRFVSNLISYQDVSSREDLFRKGALGALESKNGVCMEYSDLLLSVLRAQKIPTRTVFGDGLGARVDRQLSGVGHQWVGVWFPDAGWVSVDPTWSDRGNEYIGFDFDHFVWYVASKSVYEPNGFNCYSEDNAYPCDDALQINTESINAFPAIESLFTIEDVKAKLAQEQKSGMAKYSSEIISYLRSSRLGRILLSTQGLIIMFAFVIYVLLVVIVTFITKTIRKRKALQTPTNLIG